MAAKEKCEKDLRAEEEKGEEESTFLIVAKLNTRHSRVFVHVYTFLNSFTELLCPCLYMSHSRCCLYLHWGCASTSRCASVTESVCVSRFVRLIEKRHCLKQAEKRGNICQLHAAGRRAIVCLCDYGPSTSDGFAYQRCLHHYVSAFIHTYRWRLFFLPLESFYLLLSAHTSRDEVLLAQLES